MCRLDLVCLLGVVRLVQGVLEECSARQMENVLGLGGGGQGGTGCEARHTMVQVSLESEDWQLVGPKQVEVRRCVGSCPGNLHHSCTPRDITRMEVPVVLASLSLTPGQVESKCASVMVEEHVSCHCGCRVTQSDCLPSQQFLPYECRCVCSDHSARAECLAMGRSWDQRSCSCSCPSLSSISPLCPPGWLFDYSNTCTCIQVGYQAGTDVLAGMSLILLVCLASLFSLAQCYKRRLGLFRSRVSRVSTAASDLVDFGDHKSEMRVDLVGQRGDLVGQMVDQKGPRVSFTELEERLLGESRGQPTDNSSETKLNRSYDKKADKSFEHQLQKSSSHQSDKSCDKALDLSADQALGKFSDQESDEIIFFLSSNR